jgi:outer membrane protein
MEHRKKLLIVTLIVIGLMPTASDAKTKKMNDDLNHKQSYYEKYGYGHFKKKHDAAQKSKAAPAIPPTAPAITPASSAIATTIPEPSEQPVSHTIETPQPKKKHTRIESNTYDFTEDHTHTERKRYELKVRGSAFIPQSDLFRDIYGTAAGNVDAELAVKVYKYMQVWANIDYMQAHGKSLGFCNATHIHIINGSFGLKSPFDVNNWFTVYLGLGPTFGGIRVKDDSQFSGCSSCTKSTIGFVAKSGMDFFFRERGFVDIFFDYVYENNKASGLRIGAGLGVTF